MDHKLGGMPYSLAQGVRESLDEFVAEGFFNLLQLWPVGPPDDIPVGEWPLAECALHAFARPLGETLELKCLLTD